MPKSKSGKSDLDKSSIQLEEEKEVKEIVDKLFHHCNSMSYDITLFAKAVTSQHPTIQQNIMRLFVECFKMWAEMKEKGWYDLRNEQTCKVSARIMETFKDELSFPFV